MLSVKQQKLLEVILANPSATYVELGEIVGINRNTVTAWKRLPEFQSELSKRLKEQWQDSEQIAMESMIALAKKKDFKASKYILDSLGYAPAQKIDANVNQDINIVIEE